MQAAQLPTLSTAAAGATSAPLWKRVIDFAVHRRVPISLVLFIALLSVDVLRGVKPHSVLARSDLHSVASLAFIVAGLAIRSWAAGTLTKWGNLTTAGPYGVIRHPLYAGSFLMMIGFCDIIGGFTNIIVVCVPVMLLYFFAVRKEERRLREYYNVQWDAYAAQTPRFLPRRLPTAPFANWSARQWMNNREYQAMLASVAGLALLELWRLA
jgi:protein-S-isoprenylcysteine O-methyltransferase Ste14